MALSRLKTILLTSCAMSLMVFNMSFADETDRPSIEIHLDALEDLTVETPFVSPDSVHAETSSAIPFKHASDPLTITAKPKKKTVRKQPKPVVVKKETAPIESDIKTENAVQSELVKPAPPHIEKPVHDAHPVLPPAKILSPSDTVIVKPAPAPVSSEQVKKSVPAIAPKPTMPAVAVTPAHQESKTLPPELPAPSANAPSAPVLPDIAPAAPLPATPPMPPIVPVTPISPPPTPATTPTAAVPAPVIPPAPPSPAPSPTPAPAEEGFFSGMTNTVSGWFGGDKKEDKPAPPMPPKPKPVESVSPADTVPFPPLGQPEKPNVSNNPTPPALPVPVTPTNAPVPPSITPPSPTHAESKPASPVITPPVMPPVMPELPKNKDVSIPNPPALPGVEALPKPSALPPVSEDSSKITVNGMPKDAPVPSLPPLTPITGDEKAAKASAKENVVTSELPPLAGASAPVPPTANGLPSITALPGTSAKELPLPASDAQVSKPAPAPGSDTDASSATPTTPPDLRVVFNETQTDVPLSSYENLDKLAADITKNVNARVSVLAYAGGPDSAGVYPKRVSLARGIAVRNYLTTNKGIDIERVHIKALGNKNAGGPEDRVDLFIIK